MHHKDLLVSGQINVPFRRTTIHKVRLWNWNLVLQLDLNLDQNWIHNLFCAFVQCPEMTCHELVLHKWTKFNKGKWKRTITFKSCYIVNDENSRCFIWTRAESNQFSCKMVQSLLFVQQCPRSLTSHHLSQSLSCDQVPWWWFVFTGSDAWLVEMGHHEGGGMCFVHVSHRWCQYVRHAGHSDNVQSSGVRDSFRQTQLKQLCTAVCMSEVSYFQCLSANQSLDAPHCTVVVPGIRPWQVILHAVIWDEHVS